MRSVLSVLAANPTSLRWHCHDQIRAIGLNGRTAFNLAGTKYEGRVWLLRWELSQESNAPLSCSFSLHLDGICFFGIAADKCFGTAAGAVGAVC